MAVREDTTTMVNTFFQLMFFIRGEAGQDCHGEVCFGLPLRSARCSGFVFQIARY